MEKVNFFAMFAAATLTMGVAGCDKNVNEDNGMEVQAMTDLAVRISSAPGTRSIGTPGSEDEGTIKLKFDKSHIYVINSYGAVIHAEALTEASRTDAGQALSAKVPTDARIYIVANIPPDDYVKITKLKTFEAIKAATSLITTQDKYEYAALANIDGNAVGINLSETEGKASVSVTINPLISRMELYKLQGGKDDSGEITAFTVTGVFVDEYHSGFTYGGGNNGAKHSQGEKTDFTNVMGITGKWDATVTEGALPVAVPGTGKIWEYNVASGGLPRFIIRLENVKYIPAGEKTETTINETLYVTVTGYNGITKFERGKIYRVGGNNGITFTPSNLASTSNQKNVDLLVKVAIREWAIVALEPKL